jgi:putative intracellular protease/amidase
MDKNDKPFQIAILLYPGVTALDAVGPLEVLSRMPNAQITESCCIRPLHERKAALRHPVKLIKVF